MNLDLSPYHALVCGGSQGIGKAIAVELASLGAQITVVARTEAKLKQVVQELPRVRQPHYYLVADFQQPNELQQKVQEHIQQYGIVHILVNNTGGPKPGPIAEANMQQFQEAFQQHLICNQILAQAVIPGMKQAGYGRIINIISVSVKEPIQGLGVSNTIRAAVASWAKTLAGELASFEITVNNVLPGYTDTERLQFLLEGRAKASGKTLDQIADDLQASIPTRRFADPKETAAAVAFLASPSAAYITGINLPVDGGKTACL